MMARWELEKRAGARVRRGEGARFTALNMQQTKITLCDFNVVIDLESCRLGNPSKQHTFFKKPV